MHCYRRQHSDDQKYYRCALGIGFEQKLTQLTLNMRQGIGRHAFRIEAPRAWTVLEGRAESRHRFIEEGLGKGEFGYNDMPEPHFL